MELLQATPTANLWTIKDEGRFIFDLKSLKDDSFKTTIAMALVLVKDRASSEEPYKWQTRVQRLGVKEVAGVLHAGVILQNSELLDQVVSLQTEKLISTQFDVIGDHAAVRMFISVGRIMLPLLHKMDLDVRMRAIKDESAFTPEQLRLIAE